MGRVSQLCGQPVSKGDFHTVEKPSTHVLPCGKVSDKPCPNGQNPSCVSRPGTLHLPVKPANPQRVMELVNCWRSKYGKDAPWSR